MFEIIILLCNGAPNHLNSNKRIIFKPILDDSHLKVPILEPEELSSNKVNPYIFANQNCKNNVGKVVPCAYGISPESTVYSFASVPKLAPAR